MPALSNSDLHPDYPNVEMSYCKLCGRPVFKYPDYTLEIIDSVTESDVEHDCSTYSER